MDSKRGNARPTIEPSRALPTRGGPQGSFSASGSRLKECWGGSAESSHTVEGTPKVVEGLEMHWS